MIEIKVGDAIIYVDPRSRQRAALVTAVWSRMSGSEIPPGVNAVIVSDDPKRDDSYGRQIEHVTSVPHQQSQPAHGNYWRVVGDSALLTPIREGVEVGPSEGMERAH